ncbi:MAG: ATP-binding protein [Anaerolineae bacterium]|nr:ATP-binding protein [Anaerolineae bacterium]
MDNLGLVKLEFLLKQAIRQMEQGRIAQAAGRIDAARQHYLQAAEYLFKAADRSQGPIREKRIELAQGLLEQAEELERRAAAPAGERRDRSGPLPAGQAEETSWLVAERPAVRFDDVAGLEAVKEQVMLKLIYPFVYPDQAERFGIRRGGGILLYGPPGTGKTLIARAVAGEVDAPFYTVKPSEIMSKWVGEAEQNVQRLFAAARSAPRAVIFIDEVESLLTRRRSTLSTVMKRLVPQFLAELEGFEEKEGALLFVGATNEPWDLDPAVLRPGRFDEKVYVPLPDQAARRRILELNLRGRPLAADVDLDRLAESLAGYSGADIVNICGKACAIPFVEAVKQGVDRDVMVADFAQVMAAVKPSVDEKEVRKYEKFRFGE